MPIRTLPCLLIVALASVAHAQATEFIRVNQIGYAPSDPKVAIFMAATTRPSAPFTVIDASTGKPALSGAADSTARKWNAAFAHNYTVDVTRLSTPGTYFLQIGNIRSPNFIIGAPHELYAPLADNAAAFYAAQADQHQFDAAATVYEFPRFKGDSLAGDLVPVGGPMDVSGGWYDAGDYLEFVETISYADAALLMTARDHPGTPITAEARRGLLWLLKMWDPATKTLYIQVGIGDGNSKVTGDHDAWRLPKTDNAMTVAAGDPDWFLTHRAVLRGAPPGSPVSPNLAGRLAAAFALGDQVFGKDDPELAAKCLNAARTVFASAQTENVKNLLTTGPHGYYGESSWQDDMEWGAAELCLATHEGAFLKSAAHWAKAYLAGGDGGDTLNLYDVSGVAHYELARALGTTTGLEISRADLIAALRSQLSDASDHAAKDTFGVGLDINSGDLTPHLIGLALEASFYDELTGTNEFHDLENSQLRWILGGNAWGCSFIVGDGQTFPRGLHHQIANLTGIVLNGAVVDGPESSGEVGRTLKELPDGAKRIPADGSDPYKIFSAQGVRFADTTACYSCVEPALDYAAFSALLFLRQ